MRNPTRSLLAALVTTAVVVTAALGWAGWRLLDQQRALDEQRARDRADNLADAIAAGIRGKLAEAGERLSGWVSTPSSPVPAIEGAVVVATGPDAVAVVPSGALPFVPAGIDAPPSEPFAALEAIEFGGDLAHALSGYRRLAAERAPNVRAAALIRLGRVQRRLGDLPAALATYQRLEALGAVRAGDLPAELAALSGQQAAYVAMSDERRAVEVRQRILQGLDNGRWLITRGVAEFYREPFSDPRPASWRLASVLSDVWSDAGGRLPPRGQRVFHGADEAATNILVVWRSNGRSSAALVAAADAFLAVPAAADAVWQLVDPEGQVVSGQAVRPTRSLTRIIGNSEYPWTLHAWVKSPDAAEEQRSRTIPLAMMVAMVGFVWGGAYFMARAIRREAAVARLQSDFVAAVSHEFRSPLTSVRQMAEMLDADRVPTERRHTYYRTLAGEAARLQRLVETLLNFGRMEAGAEHYRFADVDASTLVRAAVDDVMPQARESGKTVAIDEPGGAIRVRADEAALTLALRNLIDNAIKYSPGEPTVWVRCQRDRERAAISVIDRGVGIPRSEQRSIFAKFVRGRAALDRNIKGTGVGLSMVQQIVTAHGGEIRLESEPGHGSTFTLLLPALP